MGTHTDVLSAEEWQICLHDILLEMFYPLAVRRTFHRFFYYSPTSCTKAPDLKQSPSVTLMSINSSCIGLIPARPLSQGTKPPFVLYL